MQASFNVSGCNVKLYYTKLVDRIDFFRILRSLSMERRCFFVFAFEDGIYENMESFTVLLQELRDRTILNVTEVFIEDNDSKHCT